LHIVDSLIRPYRPEDTSAVRHCVTELQEFERVLDPRLRPGQAIADDLCERMHAWCREAEGQLFIAEQEGTVVGLSAFSPGSRSPTSTIRLAPMHW
jgi:hypothetical protein